MKVRRKWRKCGRPNSGSTVDGFAKEFLSFDGNQNELAVAEGLKAPLAGA
jgi:hypothetical protein